MREGGRDSWKKKGLAPSLRAVIVASALVFSSGSWPEPSAGPSSAPEAASLSASSEDGARTISASELAQLSEISTRLASLNEKLRIELEASKSSSAGLALSLENSTRELEALRLELDRLRTNSSELELRAKNSERESTALSEALRKADDSLRSLEVSFADYRKAAEARLFFLGFGTVAALIAAAAGWAVAILALLAR